MKHGQINACGVGFGENIFLTLSPISIILLQSKEFMHERKTCFKNSYIEPIISIGLFDRYVYRWQSHGNHCGRRLKIHHTYRDCLFAKYRLGALFLFPGPKRTGTSFTYNRFLHRRNGRCQPGGHTTASYHFPGSTMDLLLVVFIYIRFIFYYGLHCQFLILYCYSLRVLSPKRV